MDPSNSQLSDVSSNTGAARVMAMQGEAQTAALVPTHNKIVEQKDEGQLVEQPEPQQAPQQRRVTPPHGGGNKGSHASSEGYFQAGPNAPGPPMVQRPSNLVIKRVGDYHIGRVLGHGTFSEVRLGTTENGRQVAVKIIEKRMIAKKNLTSNVRREISIMKKLCHTNVLGLVDVMASNARLYMVTEMMEGGNMQELIAETGKLDENTTRHYFSQLLLGLNFCHRQCVWHRDLKPENLLLDSSKKHLKISDFGLSMLLDHDNATLQTTCGTPFYVAPEILRRAGYRGATVDVWSAGCVAFCLLTTLPPFKDDTPNVLYRKILEADVKYPQFLSDRCVDMLSSILVADENKRLTINDILQHEWMLAGTGIENLEKKKAKFNDVLQITSHDLRDAIMDIQEHDPGFDGVDETNLLDLFAMSGIFDIRKIFDSVFEGKANQDNSHENEKSPVKVNRTGPLVLQSKLEAEDIARLIMRKATEHDYGGQLGGWRWINIEGFNGSNCFCAIYRTHGQVSIVTFGDEDANGFVWPSDRGSQMLCHQMYNELKPILDPKAAGNE